MEDRGAKELCFRAISIQRKGKGGKLSKEVELLNLVKNGVDAIVEEF